MPPITKKKILALLLIITAFTPTTIQPTTAQPQEPDEALRSKMTTAFKIITEADQAGLEITDLVRELNHALRLIETDKAADLEEAEKKIDTILSLAPELQQETATTSLVQKLKLGYLLGVMVTLIVIAWRYAPKIFWNLWLRTRKNWKVHP
jgi:hypothetical protein